MSNPYAPPEKRRPPASEGGATPPTAPGEAPERAPEGASGAPPDSTPAPASGGSPGAPAGGVPGLPAGVAPGRMHGGTPGLSRGGASDRSPEGVPYERPRSVRPEGPAPHPTDVHRVAVLTRTTALLVLGSVIVGLLPFPWHMSAALLAVAAIAVGGRALVVATRTRVRGTPVGVVGLLIVVAMLGLARPAQTALMWDVESQFAQCRSGALTEQASNACLSQYEQALDDWARSLTRRSG